jgi:threonine dehydrogenase-like Zn-dependent dehydrogenase
MVMRGLSCLLVGALLLLVSLATPVVAQVAKLPKDIESDIKTRFPDSKIDSFVLQPELHWEVTLTLKSGQKVDVVYKTVIKHVFAAEEIAVGSLPIAVVNALQTKYPGATINRAQKVLNPAGTLVLYELGITENGKKHEIHITPGGAIVNEFSIIGQGPELQRQEYMLTAKRRE